ncbi:MAG TPA: phosphoribosyl-AMP cyclohydrolase [Aestuariivirgaceae bacterium]|nr:phosphoribosyl-AMP cyclohydrolase [Aestuariivirgaceae bacterium]
MMKDRDLEQGSALNPRYDSAGLIPVVAQHFRTGEVLMLAYMNDEALKLTIDTGEAHYWSRSRQKLWRKGETSGEVQHVIELRIDCDQDSILLKIEPGGKGAACHTGRRSCFYRSIDGKTLRLAED